MASTGLLSATPARMTGDESLVIISSSPEFPSICDLVPKAPARTSLRSGSNAAPIPGDAPKAFTSAASVLRSLNQEDGGEIGGSGMRLALAMESTKPPALPTIELSPETLPGRASCGLDTGKVEPIPQTTTRKKKSAQAASLSATDEPVMDSHPAEAPPAKKPARKARSTKDTAEMRTTLPKGKVTKAAPKETKSKKKPETLSRHFAPQDPAPRPAVKTIPDPVEEEPLVLEPAMVRRLDWTPPREIAPVPISADAALIREVSSSACAAEQGGISTGDVFKTLQDDYGRKENVSLMTSRDSSVSTTADILGKRKLVEMVTTSRKQTPEPSPTKPKAPKKKPRTITELATAAYRLPEEDVGAPMGESKQDSLLGYLGADNEQTTAGSKSTTKAKGSKRLTKPKPLKKKEEVARKPVLLSPTSAMRQVAKQDFVFGTASQLATEDDPELLRALHEAMKISNQADGDPFDSPSSLNSSLAIRKRSGTRLWAAGARYDDGEVLDLEALDLTGSSPQLEDYVLPRNPSTNEAAADRSPSRKVCIEIQSDDTLDLTISPFLAKPKSLRPPPPHPSQILQLEDTPSRSDDQDQPPISPVLPDFEPPPSNQEHHQLLLSQSSSPLRQPEAPPRPKFELYTDAQLAKEVASFGFKAVKKRTAMIALLDQCWAGQNKTAMGTRAAMSTSAKQGASPARPRGRPRKDSVASASDTAEAPVAAKRGRKKAVPAADAEPEAQQAVKKPRGRPRKDAAASPKPPKAKTAAPKRAASPKAKASASPRRATSPSKAKAKVSPKRARSPSKLTALASATPKRRKAVSKSVVEIPDSDSEDPFASSPISSPGQEEVFSSPPQMDLSVTEDNETSLIASPTTQQVALFRYITQAVTTAPRSKDPTDPSWHEKMLMYDPVILEDLAAWLNSGQLDRVGYDKEVSPGDVKKWCESKSVCCLWRVNLNGKERKRF